VTCGRSRRRSLVVSWSERGHGDLCPHYVVESLLTRQQPQTAHRVDHRGCAPPEGRPLP
jgi:hypothetical protein